MRLQEILDSDTPLACVVQGGGMRGTYSIAALAELERLGHTKRFSAIYGSSSGALNGAYFIAGQAIEGVSIYIEHLSNKRFINPWRFWRVVDIDYLIDDVLQVQVPLDTTKLASSDTELAIFAADAVAGALRRFSNHTQGLDIFEALRATAALPIIFGREISVGGYRCVDGGLLDPLPVEAALNDGWKNILVIVTRPLAFRSYRLSLPARALMKSLSVLKGHSGGVRRRLGDEEVSVNKFLSLFEQSSNDFGTNIWVISPSEESLLAQRLTTDCEKLRETAALATHDLDSAMNSEQLVS